MDSNCFKALLFSSLRNKSGGADQRNVLPQSSRYEGSLLHIYCRAVWVKEIRNYGRFLGCCLGWEPSFLP